MGLSGPLINLFIVIRWAMHAGQLFEAWRMLAPSRLGLHEVLLVAELGCTSAFGAAFVRQAGGSMYASCASERVGGCEAFAPMPSRRRRKCK